MLLSEAESKSARRRAPLVLLVLAVTPGFSQGLDGLIQKAKNGDVLSQISLGERYLIGLGVKQDSAQAVHFYEMAAAQGAAQAQFALAEIYRSAEGRSPDYAEAVRWYKLAAAQNLGEAQFALGVMFDNGQGVGRLPRSRALVPVCG